MQKTGRKWVKALKIIR